MKFALALALFGAGAIAQACEPGLAGKHVERTESARYVLAYRAEPAIIAVGEHFTLEVAACGKNGAPPPDSIQLDAHMPAHRHGMNYTPAVRRTSSGRWHADGLMFHMPGLWEFRFDLRAAGITDRLAHSYRLD
jgi:hypothetical protein